MQYGVEYGTYKRVQKDKKAEVIEGGGAAFRIIVYMIMALLISRVKLINDIAPFGLAFLSAITLSKENKGIISSSVGTLIGYITLINTLPDVALYLVYTITIGAYGYVAKILPRKIRLILLFTLIALEGILYNYIVSSYSLGVNVVDTLIHTAVIIPIYYVFKYAIGCFQELNTKHLFNNEEIISMAILLSVAISGLGGISLFNISIRNIVALSVVLIIAYVNGSSIGAAAGIAGGIILGISSGNMHIFVSVYGVCAFITGLFRDTGKLLASLAYMVVFAILKLYANIGEEFNLIEAAITALLFLAIPQRIYNSLALELDWEKKQNIINEGHLTKVKEVLTERLKGFNDILNSMAGVLNGFMENDKLLLKSKSSGLIENLADRVCGSCDMRHICWKRELHNTYMAFGELIENYYNKSYKVPKEIEKKCVKRSNLTKEAESIVNSHIINEMWRNRLIEGRKLLSSQINGMSSTIGEIVRDFDSEVTFNHEVEKNLVRALSKSDIKYSDVFCFSDKKGRLNIRISMEVCEGGQACVKKLLPLINQSVNKTMCVSGEGCSIQGESNKCTIVYEETPKYHIATYAAIACKSGESYIGDSYSYGRTKEGNYVTIISDGMGSGADAGKDSRAAVELVEKFQEASFNSISAINTVNSIISMRFDEEEKFTTLDLNNIDLYTGVGVFMKVGAAASYVKSGKNVEEIKSKTLPMGVLDKPDVDIIQRRFKNGDIIVSISDGILDLHCKGYSSNWLYDFLKETKEANPKELVNDILEKAKELSGGKTKDDMTVLVSKVYGIFN